MRRAAGFSILELLVALVISAFVAIAIYGAFTSFSAVSSATRAQGNAWQQARTALAMMSDAIEGAGYGLPLGNCSQGIYTSVPPTQTTTTGTAPPLAFSTVNGNLLVTPVAAIPQTNAAYGYNPDNIGGVSAGVHTYALTVVAGGGNYGTVPATTITKVTSLTSATYFVGSSAGINPGDMTLVSLPDASCIMGQVTNGGGAANELEQNSGKSDFNLPNGFSAVDPSVTAAELANANVIDLGNAGFHIDNFYIADQGGTGVPCLYMQSIVTAAGLGTNLVPPPSLLARGVVDMRVAFGYGTNGTVSQYGPPGSGPAADVLAVRLQLLVRATRPQPGAKVGNGPNGVPAIALMNLDNDPATPAYYAVPTHLSAAYDTGCTVGNCTHYGYHVFDLVIPVRNDIWGQ